jgi:hypothetical protein
MDGRSRVAASMAAASMAPDVASKVAAGGIAHQVQRRETGKPCRPMHRSHLVKALGMARAR